MNACEGQSDGADHHHHWKLFILRRRGRKNIGGQEELLAEKFFENTLHAGDDIGVQVI